MNVHNLTFSLSADLLRVGSTFKGHYTLNLGIKVSEMELLVTITQVRRSPFFAPHTQLHVRFESWYSDYRFAYEFDSRYVHATRKLLITRRSPTDEPYVTLCDFHYADDDRLYCTGHHEASMHKTVSYVLVRV